MASKLIKKTYYLVTDDSSSRYYVENYGDRKFILKGKYLRGWTDCYRALNGDENWDINEENIQKIGSEIIRQEVMADEKEKAEREAPVAKRAKGWLRRMFA